MAGWTFLTRSEISIYEPIIVFECRNSLLCRWSRVMLAKNFQWPPRLGLILRVAKQDPATVIRTRDLRWSKTGFQLQTFALPAELWLGGMHCEGSISFKTQSTCIDPRSRVWCASATFKEVFISSLFVCPPRRKKERRNTFFLY